MLSCLVFRIQVHSSLRLTVTPWNQQLRFYADYPDHVQVQLPALSPTMETGTIVSWHKKEGAKDKLFRVTKLLTLLSFYGLLQVRN